MPVIAKPDRPHLDPMKADGLTPAAVKQLQKRDALLKDSIERHRTVIDLYNTYAEKQNEKHGYGKRAVIGLE